MKALIDKHDQIALAVCPRVGDEICLTTELNPPGCDPEAAVFKVLRCCHIPIFDDDREPIQMIDLFLKANYQTVLI